ncbi:MAG: DUF4440 domain-containing protein [Pseudomonadota bacterium]
MKLSLTIAAAAIALAACSQPAATTTTPPVDKAAIEAALRAAETQWNADWVARDQAKIDAHYAADADLHIPTIGLEHGADAIKAATQGALADPHFTLVFATDKVGVSDGGDLAYTEGHYTETGTNPHTHHVDTETGTYVTIYAKQADGSWLAVQDINAAGPPPAANAAHASH